MSKHLQRQLRQQRHLLYLELPESYSNRLLSKFGRNGYEASFGLAATTAATAAGGGGDHHQHHYHRTASGGDGSGDGGLSDDEGGAGTGGVGGGSRADDLNSLDGGAEEWVEMMGAVPTPASETACRVVVKIRSGNAYETMMSIQTIRKIKFIWVCVRV